MYLLITILKIGNEQHQRAHCQYGAIQLLYFIMITLGARRSACRELGSLSSCIRRLCILLLRLSTSLKLAG